MKRLFSRTLAVVLLPAALAACAEPAAQPPATVQTAPGSEAGPTREAGPLVTVYKTPTCGCCAKWVDHLRDHGFTVETVDRTDLTQVKHEHGVPQALGSCHTGVVEGYAIEGHVPADVIRRLLAERPDVKGIAVPGMPMGSPGMEGPYTEPYEVYAFGRDGSAEVYATR